MLICIGRQIFYKKDVNCKGYCIFEFCLQEDLTQESLDHQFKLVKKETLESHVSEYGDMDFQTEMLIDFQGGRSAGPVKKEPKGPRSHDSVRYRYS